MCIRDRRASGLLQIVQVTRSLIESVHVFVTLRRGSILLTVTVFDRASMALTVTTSSARVGILTELARRTKVIDALGALRVDLSLSRLERDKRAFAFIAGTRLLLCLQADI